MPATLPRSTWAWHCLTSSRIRSLMTLFCLMCLAAGSPVQKEAKTSHHPGPALPVSSSPLRPAAHFQVDPFIWDSLTWTPNIDNAFTQGSLILKNNKLHIEQKGLYFIYSQVTFGGKQCPLDKNLVSLTVILESTEHKDKMQLLRSDKTPCELSGAISANKGSRAGWNKSIFQAGAFQLKKGDILSVVVTGTDYLKRENGATYFGIYAL
ncbi:lymphotoxin-alpha-like [Bufo gargarizans]|uniref:lymphotoxin-alpha-like n=1 Tax=Bufo gargarizans TaxID=30331 RepID=UPI001CF1C8FF|nr:lymphotoxin-alpha-like [Bufo gargarizans]